MERTGRAGVEGEQQREVPEHDRLAALLTEARSIPENDPRRTAASIAMFDRLSEHWSLRGEERETLLGGVSKSTWSEWRQRPLSARVKPDTRERIANLYLIDLNAHSLFAPEFADRWVRQRNAAFGGEAPVAVMLRGKVENIVAVRTYLERVRTSSAAADSSVEAISEPLQRESTRTELERAVAIFESLVRAQPGEFESSFASAVISLASHLAQSGEIAAAVQTLRQAIEIREKIDSTKFVHQVTVRLNEPGDANDTLATAINVMEAKRPRTAKQFSDIWHDVIAKADEAKAKGLSSTRSASL